MREARNDNSDQSQQTAKEIAREIHWVEKATMWSQIGLAVIGIAALVIYHGQLTVMQRQLDEMAKATKAAMASADAARNALRTTNDSLGIANQALRLDKRAWVGLSPPLKLNFFVVDPSNQEYSLQYFLMIKNFGPAVALHVVSDFAAANEQTITKTTDECCRDAAIHYTDRAIPEVRGGYVLYPNDATTTPGNEFGTMKQLRSNRGSLYIVGCILYQDQFGVQHRTRVCLQTFNDMIRGAVSKRPQSLYACASDAN